MAELKVEELVYAIDRVFLKEGKKDSEIERFWRKVMEELGIPKEDIEMAFIEVFGLECVIAETIDDYLEKKGLK